MKMKKLMQNRWRSLINSVGNKWMDKYKALQFNLFTLLSLEHNKT